MVAANTSMQIEQAMTEPFCDDLSDMSNGGIVTGGVDIVKFVFLVVGALSVPKRLHKHGADLPS